MATALSDSIIVNASIEDVWGMLSNIEAFARIMPSCEKVTNLTPRKSINPAEPGARYSMRYNLDGKRMDIITSVTAVEESKDQKMMAFYIGEFWHCTSTFRYILDRVDSPDDNNENHDDNNNRCKVTCTCALIPNSWIGRVLVRLGHGRIHKAVWKMVQNDLREINNAVESGEIYRFQKDGSMTETSMTDNTSLTS